MKFSRNIYIAVTIAMLVLGSLGQALAEIRYHVVQPGQNLYRIALNYGVTVQAIIDANQGITEDHVPAGMKLLIPDATKEPVKGALDQLPVTTKPVSTQTPVIQVPARPTPGKTAADNSAAKPAAPVANGEDWCVAGEGHWSDGTLNISVILPFNLSSTSADDLKAQMRNVEFYQGVLMAVDEIQEAGRRVKVQAFDTGTESLYGLLCSKELQQTDVVIFAGKEEELRQVADWSDKCGTPVVSTSEYYASLQGMYDNLFQINTPKSMLYPQLTDELLRRFADYTFVFLTDQGSESKADPYSATLKQAMTRSHIAYHELTYKTPEMLMACDSILGLKDENLLFVPVTPQPEAMRKMFSGLQHVKILRDARYEQSKAEGHAPESGQPQLAVLGYPEWVLYASEFSTYYYDLNVYMFSKFYINPFDARLKRFYATFKQWYGKEPMALAPKYAILGYDIAGTFLRSLSHNGMHLQERITGEVSDGLQNVLWFSDSLGKGFYNQGFYLVHFTPESTIEKIVVQ